MTVASPPEVDTGEPEELPERSGPGLAATVVLVVCALVLAGAVGWRVGHAQGEPDPPTTGSVDAGFFQDMATHHDQAVGMSFIYLEHGTDPFLRQLATEIAIYQAGEIGMMNEYLHQWDQTETITDTSMKWMGMPTPRDQMFGMATPEEMEQLKTARGLELDDEFTRLMILHHAGGIHMAEYAAVHADHADVRRWAEGMEHAQRSDISEMNRWRADHGLAPVDPGID
jgi:uncharacterized protein (DUF305 family)